MEGLDGDGGSGDGGAGSRACARHRIGEFPTGRWNAITDVEGSASA